MSGALNHKQPITEAHFDELFPRGSSGCVLVLKDEHVPLLGFLVQNQATFFDR
jgi:hypothetical protein